MATRHKGTGIPFKLYQDNRSTSNHRGEWYARVKAFGTTDLDGLAEHIAQHGSTFTKADIAGVLYTLQDCIMELLLSGQKVRFGDLGTFYLTVKTKPAPNKDDFNAGENIEGVRLRFMPNMADNAGLTSTRLREGVKFINLADMAGDGGDGDDGDDGGDAGQQGA